MSTKDRLQPSTGGEQIPEDLMRLHERAEDCEMAHVDMHIHPQPVRELIERIAKAEASLAQKTAALKKANEGFEEYERKYYLESDKVEQLQRQVAEMEKGLKKISECGEVSAYVARAVLENAKKNS